MKLFVISVLTLMAVGTFARYDKTLPKGVRFFKVRQVLSNNVESYHSKSGDKLNYSSHLNINSKLLSEVESINDYVLKDIKSNSEKAYSELTAGSYDFNVKANVNVTAMAFGYGVTNRVSLYTIIPYYRAVVDVETKRVKNNNYNEVNKIVNSKEELNGVVLDLDSLPDADEGLVQSVVQDYYGYEPLGKWEAQGVGDIELGVKYNFHSWTSGGLLMGVGLTLPTGREDSPDIIQDFGFGSGHLSNFLEIGVGQSYKRSDFSYSLRVDNYFKDIKRSRASVENSDLKKIINEYKITPGLKFLTEFGHHYNFNKQWGLFSSLSYEKKLSSKVESQFLNNNKVISELGMHDLTSATLGIEFNSIDLFKKKKFLAPMSISIRAQKVLSGTNTPRYSLYSLDGSLFF